MLHFFREIFKTLMKLIRKSMANYYFQNCFIEALLLYLTELGKTASKRDLESPCSLSVPQAHKSV